MSEFKVARRGEIGEGVILSRLTPYGRVGLTLQNGEILAFQDLCTHDGSPFDEGFIENGELECPRHGARFDLKTGRVTRLPATEDIEVFSVRVDGEDVFVSIAP